MGANIIDTTPDEMSGFWLYHGEPISQSNLITNLVCRVVFGLLSNLLMWVPLQLLHRNGELAAVVFIIATMTYNVGTVINGLIWHTDDTASWWKGYGYCDIFVYLNYPILTIYTSCIFAILRNLAAQISLMRANTPSQREKRRHNIIQCLIIFPVPLLQVAWVYPASVHRYFILTLAGCNWQPTRTWPTLVFWCIPQPAFVIGAACYAVITFWRFRQLSRDTVSALSTTNSRATSRTRRAKRRLYFMTLSILVPYLPLMILYFVNNVRYLLPLDPYDFSAIHNGDVTGQPWNSISLLPSKAIDWASMNDRFSAMLTAIPVFLFFGMSKEALNMYRVYLVALGFGRIWPVLNEEYDPDGRSHYGSSQGILTSSETTQSYTKHSLCVTHTHLSTTQSSHHSQSHLPEPSHSHTHSHFSGTPHQSPPPTLADRKSRFFRLPFFNRSRTYDADSTPSRVHTLAPEEVEMRNTVFETQAAPYVLDRRVGEVETRVWSRDVEAGEGPSK